MWDNVKLTKSDRRMTTTVPSLIQSVSFTSLLNFSTVFLNSSAEAPQHVLNARLDWFHLLHSKRIILSISRDLTVSLGNHQPLQLNHSCLEELWNGDTDHVQTCLWFVWHVCVGETLPHCSDSHREYLRHCGYGSWTSVRVMEESDFFQSEYS